MNIDSFILILIVTDFNGDSIQHNGSPPSGFVWIEPTIAETLQISQFNEVSIGNKVFQVQGIIQDFPDRNSSFVGFYPIAIANINDVEAMGVIQTGSRVVYRNLFSGCDKLVKVSGNCLALFLIKMSWNLETNNVII